MSTRCCLLILACCLTPLPAMAQMGGMPDGAETISAPAPMASPQAAMPGGGCESCGPPPATPTTTPWYYWWDSWHWFDRRHDRGQHYTYLPPLPGWYYFRPYSVGQLRAQQEAVMQWGGDPRNPYCTGTLPQLQDQVQVRTPSTVSMTMRPAAPSAPAVAAAAPPVAPPTTPEASPQVPASIIPWPRVLCDPRFAHERATIEAPFRQNLQGQGAPADDDFQSVVDAVDQMKAILRQMTAEISVREGLGAEKFLDQLAAEAREEAKARLASATSSTFDPSAVVPATGQTETPIQP